MRAHTVDDVAQVCERNHLARTTDPDLGFLTEGERQSILETRGAIRSGKTEVAELALRTFLRDVRRLAGQERFSNPALWWGKASVYLALASLIVSVAVAALQ